MKTIEVELANDVVIVTFIRNQLNDRRYIDKMGDDLFELVAQGNKKIIIDLQKVNVLLSCTYGKFIALHKKLKELGGKLVLCGIGRHIFESFEIMKLDKYFNWEENVNAAFLCF